jgi:hypothetical protein
LEMVFSTTRQIRRGRLTPVVFSDNDVGSAICGWIGKVYCFGSIKGRMIVWFCRKK